MMRRRGRDGDARVPVMAASARRLARRCGPAASTSACSPRTPRWSSCCCSTTQTARRRRGSIPLDPRTASHLPLLACVRPGSRAGAGLCLSRARAVAPERASVRRREGAARSVRPGRCGARPLRPRRREPPGRQPATAMKSVVADPGRYDWEGDLPLQRPFARDRDLRAARARLHPPSRVRASRAAKRGTYAGLIEKIPYLKDLGVTAVELLPVFQFDPQDAPAVA